MTGQSVIRSVRPEAALTLNGTRCDIGGLTGQPIHNYLDAAWVDKLEADPRAFRFVGFKTGKTVERFPWKKRLEWMPQDAPWPPPGVSLTLEFQPPTGFGEDARPLKVLLADDFTSLAPEWKIHLSPRHERTSFRNEGKVGEIMACANTCAFAERPWLAGAVAVQCRVDPGTDRGASWGPGLALVFAESVVKLQLRPERGCFGLAAAGQETELGKLQAGKPYHLRLSLQTGRVICEASLDGKKWERLGDAARAARQSGARRQDEQGWRRHRFQRTRRARTMPH